MGEFFASLFSGLSIDSLLVYACAIRGITMGSSKDGPSILSQLLNRNSRTPALKK